jgi:hypothetical protein
MHTHPVRTSFAPCIHAPLQHLIIFVKKALLNAASFFRITHPELSTKDSSHSPPP